ncbi:MAG: DNA mismatch repair endonuclease MutL [Lachnospiraceae bacterium]|nr:DNA mismatch repair endonuclease MutL [Lachnospiraceae bacterium]
MGVIRVLDPDTINRIAAGEVIERPASIVKELIENSLDSGATSITVDIQNGGISFIRVTDNGSGFIKDDIPTAFLRHATSKIREEADLRRIRSLGFRGEALSSIASVAKVELLTKREEDFLGSRYVINGGAETSFEDIGCPNGTTFMIRDLFYNVPARRKFLKSAVTEAGYINELVNRFAVSSCGVSFSLMSQGRTILHTSGNGNRKDAVYSVYGREIAEHLIPIDYHGDLVSLGGFIGQSMISRGNRNLEMFFVNGRSVRSNILYKAIEDAYSTYLMQHKYPFTLLMIDVDPEIIDVNIHPTKQDIRFSSQEDICSELTLAVREALRKSVLIPAMEQETEKRQKYMERVPESFETKRLQSLMESKPDYKAVSPAAAHFPKEAPGEQLTFIEDREIPKDTENASSKHSEQVIVNEKPAENEPNQAVNEPSVTETPVTEPSSVSSDPVSVSQDFTKLRSDIHFRIVGQVFKTYWIIETGDRMYLIDQHAAHEKINYERFVAAMNSGEVYSQNLLPPILVSLTIREEETLSKYRQDFSNIGFVIEHFGGRDYQISAVPTTLYRMDAKEYFTAVLDELSEGSGSIRPERVYETLASMSCKAAIKGNQWISETEAEHLFTELLSLDNPFHCPHGRPTIITMTKQEMEKKFKRIL